MIFHCKILHEGKWSLRVEIEAESGWQAGLELAIRQKKILERIRPGKRISGPFLVIVWVNGVPINFLWRYRGDDHWTLSVNVNPKQKGD